VPLRNSTRWVLSPAPAPGKPAFVAGPQASQYRIDMFEAALISWRERTNGGKPNAHPIPIDMSDRTQTTAGENDGGSTLLAYHARPRFCHDPEERGLTG
jgi:hypothetical protein